MFLYISSKGETLLALDVPELQQVRMIIFALMYQTLCLKCSVMFIIEK